jgi:large subunit ribosomal protein L13
MQKNETVVRKWYVVDAADKPLGRTAVAVADLLRGKNDPTFTPHADCGNFVIVINAEKAVLTGRKMEQKYYYHHSGYIGGLKTVTAKQMMAEKPELAMHIAVKGMLPKNRLGAKLLSNLYVYEGTEHKHEAQSPKAIDINSLK